MAGIGDEGERSGDEPARHFGEHEAKGQQEPPEDGTLVAGAVRIGVAVSMSVRVAVVVVSHDGSFLQFSGSGRALGGRAAARRQP